MGKTLYLRESRARVEYTCVICSRAILRGEPYFRHEPHPKARYHRGEKVEHLCWICVEGEKSFLEANRRLNPTRVANSPQLFLEFGQDAVVHRTLVRLLDIAPVVNSQLITEEALCGLSPSEYEDLLCDRFSAMGMVVQRVGTTYQKDGGIDLLFWPEAPATIPFLGALQAKHHRSPNRKTGPSAVREFAGVLRSQPIHLGMIVTNTSFTPDAQWYAKQHSSLIRLRDLSDLRRWIVGNFTDEQEWREFPEHIDLCPGVRIPLNRPKFTVANGIFRRDTG